MKPIQTCSASLTNTTKITCKAKLTWKNRKLSAWSIMISFLFSGWSLQLWLTKLKPCLIICLGSCWICLSANFKESFWADWLKHIWLPIITCKILINSVSSMNDWIRVIMMWHPISLNVRGIASRSIRRSLLHLLLISTSLNHQNPFSISLFQHIPMNVGNVVNQAISVKIAWNPKSTGQLRSRRLSPGLTISSSVKILRHNTSAAVIIIISQKMTWTFQKTLILHRKCYKVWNAI